MDENKKKIISKNIGNRIYNLRKSNKLSRERFAEICNLSSQHVYYMEKGDFLPGCMTIIDICNNFPITPSELLIDSLNINFNILDESVKADFEKLSNKDKKFIQELLKTSINLFLEK
ncbi:MAG: helix-turn-helix transcriptional regulator [Clostridia bacterium]|nr:helix-turn-helix transcriptional regulator [Clostridia bacterium]